MRDRLTLKKVKWFERRIKRQASQVGSKGRCTDYVYAHVRAQAVKLIQILVCTMQTN